MVENRYVGIEIEGSLRNARRTILHIAHRAIESITMGPGGHSIFVTA